MVNKLSTKITFALADWIREWRKCRDNNPSIEECEKFVEWKLEDYKLSDSDKRIIESICSMNLHIYEITDFNFYIYLKKKDH